MIEVVDELDGNGWSILRDGLAVAVRIKDADDAKHMAQALSDKSFYVEMREDKDEMQFKLGAIERAARALVAKLEDYGGGSSIRVRAGEGYPWWAELEALRALLPKEEK